MNIQDRIQYAAGRKQPQLVLKNGQVINVFSGEIYPADIAISEGIIVGVGDYSGQEKIDLAGKYVCPGLMDGHMHPESSMVTPDQLARLVLPHGTTTIVTDPHEIANVCGEQGLRYILNATENLPLNIYVMLPSCVPATPLDDNGASLDAAVLRPFYGHARVLGLAEMMNYPGLLAEDAEVLRKVEDAQKLKKVLDGHAPGLHGKELAGYAAAGIQSDHECTTAEEALERIRLGQWVMIREGTAGKNLTDLMALLKNPAASGRCLLVTDDLHPEDLLSKGHIDHLVRRLISGGINPVTAVQAATINPARYFGLNRMGAIAPGYQADLVVLNNLAHFEVAEVYKDGVLTAAQGQCSFAGPRVDDSMVRNTFSMPHITKEMVTLQAKGSRARVIGLIPNQILTKELLFDITPDNQAIKADVSRDLLKAVVIERHRNTGKIGVGLVHGYGLKKGAAASSIAHDSHNLIVIGANDEDICMAANVVKRNQGGLAVVADSRLLGEMPLPIAGLMTSDDIDSVSKNIKRLKSTVRGLGVNPDIDPFMTLAFLALPVIPELKLTPRGLVLVNKQQLADVSF